MKSQNRKLWHLTFKHKNTLIIFSFRFEYNSTFQINLVSKKITSSVTIWSAKGLSSLKHSNRSTSLSPLLRSLMPKTSWGGLLLPNSKNIFLTYLDHRCWSRFYEVPLNKIQVRWWQKSGWRTWQEGQFALKAPKPWKWTWAQPADLYSKKNFNDS